MPEQQEYQTNAQQGKKHILLLQNSQYFKPPLLTVTPKKFVP